MIHAAVLQDPKEIGFSGVECWPGEMRGFEDLAFLFSSNQLNHGIASLQFDEAAYIYRLARAVQTGPIVEIGRFRGGSTFLLAVARNPGIELWSYDLSGETLDAELRRALERYRLLENVRLVVGDSRTATPPPVPMELLFIDGDHSYEGASCDLARWGSFVGPGGHVLVHDAVDDGGYGNVFPGVSRAVEELGSGWELRPGTGSIAHLVRLP